MHVTGPNPHFSLPHQKPTSLTHPIARVQTWSLSAALATESESWISHLCRHLLLFKNKRRVSYSRDAAGEDKHKRVAPTLRKYVKTRFDMKIDSPVSLIYSDSALHITSGCCHTHAAEEKKKKKLKTQVLLRVLRNVAGGLARFPLKPRLIKDPEARKRRFAASAAPTSKLGRKGVGDEL